MQALIKGKQKWQHQYQIKQTLNKASGGDGNPTELFQILKDDAVKVLHSTCSKFGKLSSGHRTGKGLHSNRKERQCQRMFKLPHNCTYLTRQQSSAQNSPSQASTVLEPRMYRCSIWIQKRQRNQRSNCQHLLDHRKKKKNSRKTSTSASLTVLMPWTVWITTNCGKFFKRWESDHPTCFLRNLYAG